MLLASLPSNKAGVVGHYHQVGHDDVIFDNRHACRVVFHEATKLDSNNNESHNCSCWCVVLLCPIA